MNDTLMFTEVWSLFCFVCVPVKTSTIWFLNVCSGLPSYIFHYFLWNFFFAHAHLLKLAEISNSLALPWCQAQVWWLMLLGLHQSTYFALHVEKMFTKKKMPSFYLARYPKPRWDVVPSTSEWLTAMNVCEPMKLPRDLHVMVGGPDLTRLSWILVQIGNF